MSLCDAQVGTGAGLGALAGMSPGPAAPAPPSPQQPQSAAPRRIEGFSDGFFAIVITLLVIELRPPELPEDPSDFLLRLELIDLWPNIAALAVSFVNILIVWVAHHEMLKLVRRFDTGFLYMNGALLFGVALLPFTTGLLAEQGLGPQATLAASIYCLDFAWIAVWFNLIWAYLSRAGGEALVDTVGRRDRRRIVRTYRVTLGLYLGAAALAWFLPLPAVALTVVLSVFFAAIDRLSGFASEDVETTADAANGASSTQA